MTQDEDRRAQRLALAEDALAAVVQRERVFEVIASAPDEESAARALLDCLELRDDAHADMVLQMPISAWLASRRKALEREVDELTQGL